MSAAIEPVGANPEAASPREAPAPRPAAAAAAPPAATATPAATAALALDRSPGLVARLRRSPLVRRVTGYSAGSVIAAFTSELAFAASFGWGHFDTAEASLVGFLGGAVPNYILNRRWAWNDRRGRRQRDEVALYAVVSILSFLASWQVTTFAEVQARGVSEDRTWQVLLVAGAYLAVSGVFFVAKFVAYELVVFTKGPAERRRRHARRGGGATRS